MESETENQDSPKILARPHEGGFLAYEDGNEDRAMWAGTIWSAVGLYIMSVHPEWVTRMQPAEGRDLEGFSV